MTTHAQTKAQTQPFTVVHGTAEHWGAAAKACLDGLGPGRAIGANMGFLYATEPFADDLGSILTFLRSTTHIEHWVGGIVPGLCAQSTEYRQCGALGLMVGTVPEGAFRPFTTFDMDKIVDSAATAAVIHGDPRHPLAAPLSADLAQSIPQVVGGLVSAHGPVYQLAGSLIAGGASGALLGPGLDLVVGISQGCTPIGPTHIVTKSSKNILIELDGLPALDILRSEVGDLISREWRRAAGYIHMALVGKDHTEYAVRTLIGIDTERGMLAVGAETQEGDKIIFVRRDANAARSDLIKMLNDLKDRLGNRQPLGALYFSCTSRGVHMFGSEGAELELIQRHLGNVPLLGFMGNGELAQGQLYGYTGVLALLVTP